MIRSRFRRRFSGPMPTRASRAAGPAYSQEVVAPPGPPTSLAAVDPSAFSLSWTLPAGTLTKINMYYRDPAGSGGYVLYGSVAGNATSGTIPIPPLVVGNSTNFYVTAVGVGGESVPSNVVTDTPTGG